MVQPDASSRPLEAGARLGRFELLSLVAQGGMGAVWAARARDGAKRESLVALKTILPGGANDAAIRAMFLDEARLAQLVAHPNICRLVDFGNEGGTLYMVLEWVEGDSLRVAQREPTKGGVGGQSPPALTMPYDVALRIVRRVCDALHWAHEVRDDHGRLLGIVHRDVTPHNILLGVDGGVKLIDFGIAKTRQRLAETTNSGVLKGKLRYMAPEQVEGGAVDRRTDIWALGAVLHGLVSGGEIFGDMGEPDILRRLVMREALPSIPPDVPAPIAAVIARALSFDADARFPTAEAMRHAIDDALASLGGATTSDDEDRARVAAFAAERLSAPLAARRASLAAARATLSSRVARSWRGRIAAGAAAIATATALALGVVYVRAPKQVAAAPAAAVTTEPAPAAAPPLPPPVAATVTPVADAEDPPKKARPASTTRPQRRSKQPRSSLGGEFDTHD